MWPCLVPRWRRKTQPRRSNAAFASRPEMIGGLANGDIELHGPHRERQALLRPDLKASENRLSNVLERLILSGTLAYAARDRGALGDNHPRLVALQGDRQLHARIVARPGPRRMEVGPSPGAVGEKDRAIALLDTRRPRVDHRPNPGAKKPRK